MSDDLTKPVEERALLTAFSSTDDLLAELEAILKEVLSERSDAEALIAELEKHVAEGRQHESAITEALVVAARVRAASEREAEELKALIKSESESKADEILRAAEARAATILEDARLKARAYEQETRDAEQLAQQTRAGLASFLESLLARVQSPGADLASAVDDLLVRVGDAAKSDPDSSHTPAPATRSEPERFDHDGPLEASDMANELTPTAQVRAKGDDPEAREEDGSLLERLKPYLTDTSASARSPES